MEQRGSSARSWRAPRSLPAAPATCAWPGVAPPTLAAFSTAFATPSAADVTASWLGFGTASNTSVAAVTTPTALPWLLSRKTRSPGAIPRTAAASCTSMLVALVLEIDPLVSVVCDHRAAVCPERSRRVPCAVAVDIQPCSRGSSGASSTTRVFLPPFGSASTAVETTLSFAHRGAAGNERTTARSSSPCFRLVTVPASSTAPTRVGSAVFAIGSSRRVPGSSMICVSEEPENSAAAVSKVWTGTPGVAVLDSCMPAGITSGSCGRAAGRIAADLADGGDGRARLVAEQRDQAGDAGRELGGAQVALVRDPLVVEGEDVGEIGPPFERSAAPRSPGAGRQPRSACSPARGCEQRAAEAGEVVDAVGDRGEPGRVCDDRGGSPHDGRRTVATARCVTCRPPRSPSATRRRARLGSLSTRRIWSGGRRPSRAAQSKSESGRPRSR